VTMSPDRAYQRCTRCIMDTTDPEISFDEAGICNHCHRSDWLQEKLRAEGPSAEVLARSVAQIKADGRGKPYDCLIGVSGGVDSSYVAWQVKQLGLRPLAVHFDSGWNSELAVRNIENIIRTLDIHLDTFVCDWEEMRDLQLAFFKASLANADVPQDHGFLAVLWRTAARTGIKWIISGHNLATESILPRAWGYNARDLRHLKGVHRAFGQRPLRKYPTLSAMYDYVWCRRVRGIRTFPILNYMPYVKTEAMSLIERELGWTYYGGKHYESIFTRFFQAHYLPTKFGFDKRLAHLSSVVVSGQLSRADALAELERDHYPAALLREDRTFVIKKLGIDEAEWERIMASPKRTYRDYPSNDWLFQLRRRFVDWR
jgi:N-acetyl sugar amidotransferase